MRACTAKDFPSLYVKTSRKKDFAFAPPDGIDLIVSQLGLQAVGSDEMLFLPTHAFQTKHTVQIRPGHVLSFA